jgi:putative effector of murein hydrolase
MSRSSGFGQLPARNDVQAGSGVGRYGHGVGVAEMLEKVTGEQGEPASAILLTADWSC